MEEGGKGLLAAEPVALEHGGDGGRGLGAGTAASAAVAAGAGLAGRGAGGRGGRVEAGGDVEVAVAVGGARGLLLTVVLRRQQGAAGGQVTSVAVSRPQAFNAAAG